MRHIFNYGKKIIKLDNLTASGLVVDNQLKINEMKSNSKLNAILGIYAATLVMNAEMPPMEKETTYQNKSERRKTPLTKKQRKSRAKVKMQNKSRKQNR